MEAADATEVPKVVATVVKVRTAVATTPLAMRRRRIRGVLRAGMAMRVFL
jgi:hypothetical protein